MTHSFNCRTSWNGGLAGDGMLSCSGLETTFSVPKELNGSGHGTNPEELLLGASSSCFLITVCALLCREKISVSGLSLQSEIIVEVSASFSVQAIRHSLTVILGKNHTQAVIDQVQNLVQKAEQFCMVSKALRPNVAISFDTEFKVGS